MTSSELWWLEEAQVEPELVMLAQGWVCVPLPEGLGWGDGGSLG